MKKYVCILCIIVLATSIVACSGSATEGTDASDGSSSATALGPITFTDPAFEAKVRTALGKPDGDITVGEAGAVKELDLANESFDQRNANADLDIRAIADIKYFASLETLDLSYNTIADLSPLSDITSLKSLFLVGVQADDFSPLADLTNLTGLTMQWIYGPDQGYYGLESLDVLANMKDLEVLDVKGCGVKDISALAGLPKLWSVFLDQNLITDVSPLAALTGLKELQLAENPITDFSPLKDIYDQLEYKNFEL
jgi:internalin A